MVQIMETVICVGGWWSVIFDAMTKSDTVTSLRENFTTQCSNNKYNILFSVVLSFLLLKPVHHYII